MLNLVPAVPRCLQLVDDADDLYRVVLIDVRGLADNRASFVREQGFRQRLGDDDIRFPFEVVGVQEHDLLGREVAAVDKFDAKSLDHMFVTEVNGRANAAHVVARLGLKAHRPAATAQRERIGAHRVDNARRVPQ